MTKYTGADVGFFLVGGYDMLGYTTKFEMNNDAKMEDTTVFGDSWAKQAPVNLREFSASHDAFYDDTALASNAALVTQIGTNRILNIGVETNTFGKKMIGFEGPAQSNYDRKVSRGGLHKVSVNWAGTGVTDDGVILLPQSTIGSSTSNGAGYDQTVSSTSTGGVMYVQITALSGSYVVFKLQDAPPPGTVWTDRITSGNLVVGAYRLPTPTISTTIVQHVRYTFAITGGSSINAFVGWKRGQ